MAKYATAEQRRAEMEMAHSILATRAKALGMTTAATFDVIRVRSPQGQTILSLYAPSWNGSDRWFVEGEYVPIQLGRIVGRRRYSSRRTFWRSTGIKAATEALQYLRGATAAELVEHERSEALATRQERPSPYAAEINGRYISDSEVHAFAKAAYLDGFRSDDDAVNATIRFAVLRDADRLSDNLWYELIWNSFTPAMIAAQSN